MNKIFKKIVSLLVTLCMVLGLSSVNALASDATLDKDIFLQTVQEMSKYIKQDNEGKLQLLIKAKSISIDETYYNAIMANLDMVNYMIEAGYLIADSQGNINITNKYIESVQNNVDTLLSKTRSTSRSEDFEYNVSAQGNTLSIETYERTTRTFIGYNKLVWTWYGFDIYLDTHNSSIVCTGTAATATILGVFFPEPVISKCVAVALTIYSAAISVCNRYGTGVIVSCYFSLVPPSCAAFWVSSQ